jgi:adenylate cyclase class 2
MIEIEIKIRVADIEEIKRQLRRLGWRVSVRREIERNFVYDRPDDSLYSAARLLRVRQVGKRGWLTVKGPPQRGVAHKVRPEYEIETADPPVLVKMVETLGFVLKWRYEKFRTTYRRAEENGKILLDETPIGNFVELEGSPGWIDATARKLGFDRSNYVKDSYRELFIKYQRTQPNPLEHMVFAPKSRPRAGMAR